MKALLKIHPSSRCDAVTEIEAEVRRGGDRLVLDYVATGAIGRLLLPVETEPGRADELWRRCCFEAFLRAPDGRYVELNFAPSRQWAAYAFDSYRKGMRPLPTPDPAIAVDVFEDRLELTAVVEAPYPQGATGWRMGLSAVIEEDGGRISYWAIEHPPGKPDFHHPDGFALVAP
jgi:hypothetical protein